MEPINYIVHGQIHLAVYECPNCNTHTGIDRGLINLHKGKLYFPCYKCGFQLNTINEEEKENDYPPQAR